MMWRQCSVRNRSRAAQTVYAVMLVLACVFLCIAIAFPTYEYISRKYWQHPDTSPLATPATAPSPATPAAPTPPAEGGTTAPAATP
jgi:TRAP-type C4-dicarboxylate transport system permease small subunit